MAKATQPVSVNGVEFDALLTSEEGYEANIPEYPTEKGFSVSDNIALKPDTLNMTLFVTDTPVTWLNRHGTGNADAVVNQIKDVYFARQLVEVVTSSAVYTDMGITKLSISKSKEIGYAKEVSLSLKKVIVTESATVSIPASYGKSGGSKASAGTASTTAATGSGGGMGKAGESGGSSGAESQSGGGSGGSWAYNLAHGAGLL